MNELDNNIIAKYIDGSCTDDELKSLDAWLKQSPDNAREFFAMDQVYREAKAKAMPEAAVGNALERLHSRIEKEQRHTARIVFMQRLRTVAAAIVAIIVVGAGVQMFRHRSEAAKQPEYLTAVAASGDVEHVVLPDGSQVWLNSGSQIRYPKVFDGSVRNVEIKGEGYFEVAKDKKKPFIVESNAMRVKVLGTVFNIRTDTIRHIAEVSLVSGSVEATSLNTPGQVVLEPGQKARLDYKSGRMTVDDVDARIDAVWHDGMIPFDNADIHDIVRTLERLYGVQIVVGHDIDCNRTYSGQIIRKQSIDEVLSLLRNALPIDYQRRGGKIYLSKSIE